ncbi:C39 family peptidase [Carnobacterium gallinarum]|uniref:C39 family peptidase n=1 Tax=Carnobacterium gallinarum TaxID=2749 RepID=UPI000556BF18|nr:C39 family peptidase [Carnobacterium gallinarum]
MNKRSFSKFGLILLVSVGLIFFINEHWIQAETKKTVNTASISESVAKKQTKTTSSSESVPPSIQLDVPLVNQMDEPALYNGCEVSSLTMLLQYAGVEVSKNDLAAKLKSVPIIDEDGYMGNPNKAFVGDITGGGEGGLGVYHKPVANLAKKYISKKKVNDITGSSFDDLLKQVAAGNPVWIITTANFVPVDSFETWETAEEDLEITYDMHSVVVTGYDADSIYINNPYGEKDQQLDKADFVAAFEQMGSQAIYLDNTL